ncbi:UNVERIFIED_CONTAM: hypothetical protein K2H54_074622 [Gekko kuhli]
MASKSKAVGKTNKTHLRICNHSKLSVVHSDAAVPFYISLFLPVTSGGKAVSPTVICPRFNIVGKWRGWVSASPQQHDVFMHLTGFPHLFSNHSQTSFATKVRRK